MTRTDGIDTHCLELQQFAVQGILMYGSTQTTQVVVLADTIQLHILAIEPETGLRIEAEIAERRRGDYLVNHITFTKYARANLINIWGLRRPTFQGRGIDMHHCPLAASPCHLIAGSIGHDVLYVIVLACHNRRDLYLSRLRIGLYMYTPLSYMNIFGLRKPYVAIDATTGIPARIGLVAIVHTYGNHIIRTAQVASDIDGERAIAVGTVVNHLAIDEDEGIHIDTVKLEEILTDILHVEMFSVPAHAAGQSTATGSRLVLGTETTLDGPVVRQVQQAPLAVVILHISHVHIVA